MLKQYKFHDWDLKEDEAVEYRPGGCKALISGQGQSMVYHEEFFQLSKEWRRGKVGEGGSSIVDDVGVNVVVSGVRREGGEDLCSPISRGRQMPCHPQLGEAMGARFNVRLFDPDREFEYSRVASQEVNLDVWHKSRKPKDRVIVLEIGAGTQVPTVRKKVFGRGPGQKGFLTDTDGALDPRASLIRINVEHAAFEEEDELALFQDGRAVSLSMTALYALQKIGAACR